jgi:uracil-DNA glycosylase family 4
MPASKVTSGGGLDGLGEEVEACRRCARLVAWREQAAAEKRAAFAHEPYWGKPITGFGDPLARVLVVGLAPAAHGGNRTGRVFTGDRSGDFLFGALHRAGMADRPTSVARDDGLRLTDAYVTAVVRCAPPANRPTPIERDTCLPFLVREVRILTRVRVLVALGAFAWDGLLRAVHGPDGLGYPTPRPRPRFGHGAEVPVGPFVLLGCFHPSQQNTFTGTLTPAMIDGVFERAKELAARA